VGGDFFDVIPLGDGRVAVALGDVTGHGIAASVLMTAAQGFLHAALRCSDSVAAAVTDLNRFIYPRRPASSFLTLWVGLFDATAGTVTYVNAGHGYALLQAPGGDITMLDGGEDFPIGFDEDVPYGQTVAPLPAGGRALVISDGLVEQFDPGRIEPHKQFGLEGVQAVLAKHATAEAVGALFDAVFNHADSDTLQDDATAVMVTWSSPLSR
jgi:serine phosphatase RsbU (regulator of sigma subunit)